MDCFKIEWKGYYSPEAALGRPEAREKGLYAIYQMGFGDPERLRYVGKSQELGRRLKEHLQSWSRVQSEGDAKRISICLGVIHPLAGSRISAEQLRDVESILIHSAKPVGNKSATKRYTGRPIIVVNTGKIGLLARVISSHPDLLGVCLSNPKCANF